MALRPGGGARAVARAAPRSGVALHTGPCDCIAASVEQRSEVEKITTAPSTADALRSARRPRTLFDRFCAGAADALAAGGGPGSAGDGAAATTGGSGGAAAGAAGGGWGVGRRSRSRRAGATVADRQEWEGSGGPGGQP